MKLRSIILIVAALLFAAGAAFASTVNASIDTSAFAGKSGSIYFQYLGTNALDSTATISNLMIDGSAIGPVKTLQVTAPDWFDFDEVFGINFGNPITYSVNFAFLGAPDLSDNNFGSTLSAWLYIPDDGYFAQQWFADFKNDGSTVVTPEPSSLLLLGPALLGIFAFRKQLFK
jgi:hypothetical protein